jgi:hypothetical protein
MKKTLMIAVLGLVAWAMAGTTAQAAEVSHNHHKRALAKHHKSHQHSKHKRHKA